MQTKSNKKKISIIVPIYKAEKTISRCVRSILDQTYTNTEIILVDDGSPDSSGKICDEFAINDKRVKVIHQKNAGVSVARNIGIENATGTYIQFVDSDDYLELNMCEVLQSYIDKYNVDMVCCGFRRTCELRKFKASSVGCGYYNSFQVLDKNILGLYYSGFFNSPCNKLYKRSLILEGFPINTSLGEDLIFNLRYFDNINSFYITNNQLYNYVDINTLSLSKSSDAGTFKIITKNYCELKRFYYRHINGECFYIINNIYLKNSLNLFQSVCQNHVMHYFEIILFIRSCLHFSELNLASKGTRKCGFQVRFFSLLVLVNNPQLVYLFLKLKLWIKKLYGATR